MAKDGDVTLSRTINISGKTLSITQNLFEGLRRIRHPAVSRRIWIDAVCINQNDIAERSAQVAQMAEVYVYETHAIIWLGEGESECEDEAIANLARFEMEWIYRREESKRENQALDSLVDFEVAWIDQGRRTDKQTTMLKTDGRPLKLSDTFEGLQVLSSELVLDFFSFSELCSQFFGTTDQDGSDLARNICTVISTAGRPFTRRYWERRWIVQELYHSTRDADEICWGPCVFKSLENLRHSPLWWIVNLVHNLKQYSEDLLAFGVVTKEQFEHIHHAHRVFNLIRDIGELRHGDRSNTELRSKTCRNDTLVNILDRFSFTR